jgi:hypothetical protein
MRHLILGASALVLGTSLWAANTRSDSRSELRDARSFDAIDNRNERSRALFMEAAKVITHPRCMNCHPATRRPTQGEYRRPHQPFVLGGEEGHGLGIVRCTNCHQDQNNAVAGSGGRLSIPGNAHWALAPTSMAWQGRTVGQICRQIKDPARNGERDLAEIVHHMSEDSLVGWAWNPGAGRVSAPGTQEGFGALIKAWAQSGAACPE